MRLGWGAHCARPIGGIYQTLEFLLIFSLSKSNRLLLIGDLCVIGRCSWLFYKEIVIFNFFCSIPVCQFRIEISAQKFFSSYHCLRFLTEPDLRTFESFQNDSSLASEVRSLDWTRKQIRKSRLTSNGYASFRSTTSLAFQNTNSCPAYRNCFRFVDYSKFGQLSFISEVFLVHYSFRIKWKSLSMKSLTGRPLRTA